MYSALNNRLLFPPRTTSEPGTVGPIDRMSYPRTLYSPPSNNRSKIGSALGASGRRDVLKLRPEADGGSRRMAKEPDPFQAGFDEIRVAAEHRQVD